jgi:hypothetical protein
VPIAPHMPMPSVADSSIPRADARSSPSVLASRRRVLPAQRYQSTIADTAHPTTPQISAPNAPHAISMNLPPLPWPVRRLTASISMTRQTARALRLVRRTLRWIHAITATLCRIIARPAAATRSD